MPVTKLVDGEVRKFISLSEETHQALTILKAKRIIEKGRNISFDELILELIKR